jgi:hypothetical protein
MVRQKAQFLSVFIFSTVARAGLGSEFLKTISGRDSISRPMTPQEEKIPLVHAARAFYVFHLFSQHSSAALQLLPNLVSTSLKLSTANVLFIYIKID